jgi:hypothetical protein
LGIKLKNIKYSKISKVIGVIMAWLCFVSICGSVFFIIENEQIITCKSYYSSSDYISNFTAHVTSIVDYHIWLKSAKNEKEIWDLHTIEEDGTIDEKIASFHNATRIISSLLIIHFLFDTLKSIAGMLDLRKAIVNYSDLSVNKYKEIIIKYKRFFLAFPRLLFLNAGILNRDVRGILNERISILNDRINKIKVEIKSRFQT